MEAAVLVVFWVASHVMIVVEQCWEDCLCGSLADDDYDDDFLRACVWGGRRSLRVRS